jgi:hypothetical protein
MFIVPGTLHRLSSTIHIAKELIQAMEARDSVRSSYECQFWLLLLLFLRSVLARLTVCTPEPWLVPFIMLFHPEASYFRDRSTSAQLKSTLGGAAWPKLGHLISFWLAFFFWWWWDLSPKGFDPEYRLYRTDYCQACDHYDFDCAICT